MWLPVVKYGFLVCAVATTVVLITYFSVFSKGGSDKCMTLDHLPGICVERSMCPSGMNSSMSGNGSIPSTVQPNLNFSRCYNDTDKQNVCCPLEVPVTSIQKTGHGKLLYLVYQPPPNVTGHPNIDLLPKTCGQNSDDQILGGRKTGLFQYPWMALIIHRNGSDMTFACGGTIISNRYILTAAHCVTSLGTNVTVAGVRVGDHDLSTDTDCEWRDCAPEPQDFFDVELIPHSAYNTVTRMNDIALVRLDNDINFELANSQPICLPVTEDWANMNLVGLEMMVAGWGLTEKDNFTSDVLLEATVPIIDNAECGRIYKRQNFLSAPDLALPYHATKSAPEDKRALTPAMVIQGPLKMLTRTKFSLVFVQYGVVSLGPQQCGTLGKPGIYTRVAYYMDWILDNLKPSPVEDYEDA